MTNRLSIFIPLDLLNLIIWYTEPIVNATELAMDAPIIPYLGTKSIIRVMFMKAIIALACMFMLTSSLTMKKALIILDSPKIRTPGNNIKRGNTESLYSLEKTKMIKRFEMKKSRAPMIIIKKAKNLNI